MCRQAGGRGAPCLLTGESLGWRHKIFPGFTAERGRPERIPPCRTEPATLPPYDTAGPSVQHGGHHPPSQPVSHPQYVRSGTLPLWAYNILYRAPITSSQLRSDIMGGVSAISSPPVSPTGHTIRISLSLEHRQCLLIQHGSSTRCRKSRVHDQLEEPKDHTSMFLVREDYGKDGSRCR